MYTITGMGRPIDIYPNPFLLVDDDPAEEEIDREWIERLFSLPWKPWVKTKLVERKKPDPNFYRFGDKLTAHPVTIDRLQKVINKGNLQEELRQLQRMGAINIPSYAFPPKGSIFDIGPSST